MFGFAWLTVRQVQEAVKHGKLDEARRLLEQPSLRSHRKAGELAASLARAYAERGEKALRADDPEAGWRDLLEAERLGGDKAAERLRRDLASLGLAEVRALLMAGETARADEARLRLRQRGVRSPELLVIEEGLHAWLRAGELADQGELALAVDTVERARRLLPGNDRLEGFAAQVAQRASALPEVLAALHQAAAAEDWSAVLAKAEQALALAPQHAEARTLRTRAWRAVEPPTLPHPGLPEGAKGIDALPRFLLWIDGVGGYLVCLGSRLTFGQARPDARVDVPLLADVARLHATLGRDQEGYVVEAVRPLQVNGNTTNRAILRDGDKVTLGASCRFVFKQPVPGSNTARIDMASGHRLPAGVDGVLLMAEALVLGGPQPHLAVPGLETPVVLFRHKDGLGLRCSAELQVNGQPATGRTILPPVASIAGQEVTFAIEPAA
ncbi:MAG: FHA domain-containing protein [Gemmataceae bacterium]|nr:FHA domain-containing protein [Gemmataceae bacterium]